MTSINSTNTYTPAPQTPYVPPVRQPDSDTQRYTAQTQAQANKPTVNVTISPEAQKALAAQQGQSVQT